MLALLVTSSGDSFFDPDRIGIPIASPPSFNVFRAINVYTQLYVIFQGTLL